MARKATEGRWCCLEVRKLVPAKHNLEVQSNHSELHSETAEILGLSYQEFKRTTINMLKSLVEKVDNMQEQMANASRVIETLRKHQNKS